MVLKVTKLKVIDTILIEYEGKEYPIAVLLVYEDGKIREYKILGICEFFGNPLSSRKPRDEKEIEVLKKVEEFLKREDVSRYIGKRIKME